jgi:hypothetical protein
MPQAASSGVKNESCSTSPECTRCLTEPHHPGAGKLRRALSIYREDPAFVRSTVEGRFLELAKAAGLPRPAMNFNVAGFELDAYWKRERFAVELDVYETHGTRGAFERDRLRQRQEDLKRGS